MYSIEYLYGIHVNVICFRSCWFIGCWGGPATSSNITATRDMQQWGARRDNSSSNKQAEQQQSIKQQQAATSSNNSQAATGDKQQQDSQAATGDNATGLVYCYMNEVKISHKISLCYFFFITNAQWLQNMLYIQINIK